jgi:iron complex outermembrane receptor protein
MSAVTPLAGLNFRVSQTLSVYANAGRSFETPTTTELTNRPSGEAGLNPDLGPQRGTSLEAGVKQLVAGRLMYDAAIYRIVTTDEMVPYEVPGSPGRRYFRNAGKTSREGAEAGITLDLGTLMLGGSWSAIRYEYDEFTVATTVLDGKRVPGVAPSSTALIAGLNRGWAFGNIEMRHVARIPVDDANTQYAPAAVLWNVRFGLRALAAGIEPVIGVDNVFDRVWVGNVVANAARGRFFETGPGRRLYGMLSWTRH